MFKPLGTPAERQGLNYEFTPIGHIKEKENLDGHKSRSQKRSLIGNGADLDADLTNIKRVRVVDDTILSQGVFNDTTFDDTLPEQSLQVSSGTKKNLASRLIDVDANEKANNASNPLKEQQDTLQKLSMENYSLRVKCNSLLKFLNNISDDGQLKGSLEILDELQEWKTKHHKLLQDFKMLQEKFDEVHRQEEEESKSERAEDHKQCETLRKELEMSLKDTRSEIAKLSGTITDLEQIISKNKKDFDEKEQQYKMNSEMLKSEIKGLKLSLEDKSTKLSDAEAKLSRLRDQMQEFDHASGSLLELERLIDEKNQGLRNLEDELRKLNHLRQDLERQLAASNDTIESLRKEYDTFKQNTSSKMEYYQKTFEGNWKSQIDALEKDNSNLKEARKKLEAQNEDFSARLQQALAQLDTVKREKERITRDHEDKVSSMRMEVNNLHRLNDQLERDSHSYKKQLEQVLATVPKNNSTEQSKMAKEVSALKSTIKDLEHSLRESDYQLEAIKLEHRKEKARLEAKLSQYDSVDPLENTKLEKELRMLKLEINSIQDTKERELALWENKYEALKESFSQLVKENKNTDLHKLLEEKRDELSALMKRHSDLNNENATLLKELNKQKAHKDAYKEELKKVSSRLELITKEFIKLKDTHPENKASVEELQAKWNEKYQSMKSKLIAELKALQDENIQLEKRHLAQVHNQQGPEAPPHNSSLQDKLDFYRLKYHNEVKKNNDLYVINGYLNRVLKATSQHVKLDIIKLESELPPLGTDIEYPPDYPYNFHNLYPRTRYRPLTFKTLALLVLACVRMKQIARKRRWDQQRIEYLQRRITYGEDKITW